MTRLLMSDPPVQGCSSWSLNSGHVDACVHGRQEVDVPQGRQVHLGVPMTNQDPFRQPPVIVAVVQEPMPLLQHVWASSSRGVGIGFLRHQGRWSGSD